MGIVLWERPAACRILAPRAVVCLLDSNLATTTTGDLLGLAWGLPKHFVHVPANLSTRTAGGFFPAAPLLTPFLGRVRRGAERWSCPSGCLRCCWGWWQPSGPVWPNSRSAEERKGTGSGRSGRLLCLAEAFVSGGLLNAALVHLLAETSEQLEESMRGKVSGEDAETFPLAQLLCGLGALMAHFAAWRVWDGFGAS
ncbi:unnamed protein product [Effrenium voratum]|nr:unnamed protein product [Effrenium voratum]